MLPYFALSRNSGSEDGEGPSVGAGALIIP